MDHVADASIVQHHTQTELRDLLGVGFCRHCCQSIDGGHQSAMTSKLDVNHLGLRDVHLLAIVDRHDDGGTSGAIDRIVHPREEEGPIGQLAVLEDDGLGGYRVVGEVACGLILWKADFHKTVNHVAAWGSSRSSD